MSNKKRKRKSLAELISYMHMLENGMSYSFIHRKYGINEDRIKVLWSKYKQKGVDGLKKSHNIKADFALKKQIVLDIEKIT